MTHKYKFVYPTLMGKHLYYRGQVYLNGITKAKSFKNERDAAMFVDLVLIEGNKDPVNILKRIK